MNAPRGRFTGELGLLYAAVDDVRHAGRVRPRLIATYTATASARASSSPHSLHT